MRSVNNLSCAPIRSGAAEKLAMKIHDRSARVGVIGLGYVGLPLATEMAKAGFKVTGIDIDKSRVEAVNAGMSYVPDVPSTALLPFVYEQRLTATQSLATVESLDAVSICVPTPLRKTKDPDMSYVIASVEAIHNHLSPGQLIILESTTYPGTTREVVLPILERSGMEVGRDFFLAFSPERIDPGNLEYTTINIPKVIGGVTPVCLKLAKLFYEQFIQTVVPVPNPETAEMVKLLENTFRSVNIALANEMAVICHKLGINVWEVIDAAKSKPFGFMPFYPGPGLGGHCIPIDPYYLVWKSKMNGLEPRLVEMAGLINSYMPGFVMNRIADALNDRKKSLKGSKILGIGVAYKSDTNDIRESPALEVLLSLQDKGANVFYSDPYVTSITLNGMILQSSNLAPGMLEAMDCVVILTNHSGLDYEMIATHSKVIVDCRNALKNFRSKNIIAL